MHHGEIKKLVKLNKRTERESSIVICAGTFAVIDEQFIQITLVMLVANQYQRALPNEYPQIYYQIEMMFLICKHKRDECNPNLIFFLTWLNTRTLWSTSLTSKLTGVMKLCIDSTLILRCEPTSANSTKQAPSKAIPNWNYSDIKVTLCFIV